jgi:hypothetical protein
MKNIGADPLFLLLQQLLPLLALLPHPYPGQ